MSKLRRLKKLGEPKNWKIKKITKGDGSFYYECYYRTFLFWYVDTYEIGEFMFHEDVPYRFGTETKAKEHVIQKIDDNRKSYDSALEDIKASKIKKTESIYFKTPEKERDYKIDSVLGD
jgi:hypothetical protein